MKSKLVIFGALFIATVVLSLGRSSIGQNQADKLPVADKEASKQPGKELDKVVDTVRTFKTAYSTVDLHESINSKDRFYVAPHFRFLLLESEKPEIARPTRDEEKGTVPVQMLLEMVHPEVRAELKAIVIREIPEITTPDIRNLQVDSIRVGVDAKEDRELYGVEDWVRTNPKAGAEKLAVSLSVKATKARQFAEAVNKGKINFIVTYSFNQISLDSRVEMLRASTLLDTQQVRELNQKGAAIMSARQMAEAATNIKREIESKVIEGIGKIEPQSLPMERLIQLFSVGKTWEMTEKQLEEMDQRLMKQFDLKVDPKEFQPFRFQKKVIETLGKETSVANKMKAYFDLYKREASSMKVSAWLKIGPFGAREEHGREFERKMMKGNMTDDEFREHIKTYHGAEYTTQMVLERGVEVYDVQKVHALGEMRVISVTLKPTLGTGLRNITLIPTLKDAVYVDHRFTTIEDRLSALESTRPAKRLKDLETEWRESNRTIEKLKEQVASLDKKALVQISGFCGDAGVKEPNHKEAWVEWKFTSRDATVALRTKDGHESHFADFSNPKGLMIAVIAGMNDWAVDFWSSGVRADRWKDVQITGVHRGITKPK